jgi:hypothetical protein
MTARPVIVEAASVSAAFWTRMVSSSDSVTPTEASDQAMRVTDVGILMTPEYARRATPDLVRRRVPTQWSSNANTRSGDRGRGRGAINA